MRLQQWLHFSKSGYHCHSSKNDKYYLKISYKNCAPFTKCITKIGATAIDDAEGLDLVMPMYNLMEYSSNYFEKIGNLWFYSKDELNNFNEDIAKKNNFNIRLNF